MGAFTRVRRPFGRTVLAATVGCAVAVSVVAWRAGGATARPADVPIPAQLSAEQADVHAAVVAAEDRRLTEIRTITSLARWQGQNWKTPYRLGSASGYTLVLTPRSAPYTVEDLLQLAPQTFLRMSDGSYLLSEHIVVTPRATLRLSAPGGLRLRLASNTDGFSTVVSLGGRLEILGEPSLPVQISSWDPVAGIPDATTTDGRSYLRAVGGQFEARHVALSRLGFWAGRTGGLALTGTDRPNTGAVTTGEQGDDGGTQASLLGDVTWQPAGPLKPGTEAPLGYSVPESDFVSGRVSNLRVEQDAFGLFVSGANGVVVSDSTFTANELGGVVFHRYVSNGVIVRTVSSENVGDGFSIDRATTGITVSESTALKNTGNGFTFDGRPLAQGPSAVGAPLRAYGNNSLSNSRAEDNGRFGVELLGGTNLSVSNTFAAGHDMGIVVNGPATRVSITANTVRGSNRHGIALVNSVTDSTVTGNVVDGASTGVYLRDSTGEVRGNTVQGASGHGVSLVGQVDGTKVSFNVLAGTGASALDTRRSAGDIASTTNNLAGWHDTTPWYVLLKRLLRPMNALWTGLAVLIAVSAVRGRRSTLDIVHPYAHQLAHQGVLPIPNPHRPIAAPDLESTAVISLLPDVRGCSVVGPTVVQTGRATSFADRD